MRALVAAVATLTYGFAALALLVLVVPLLSLGTRGRTAPAPE